jgi:6-phosphofructokinase 1
MFAGLVGSIDNDLVGTDMTIGADTALHRIVDAVDALGSTAASHHRCFVVEVMGRHCGYLALMGAIAGAADYVLVPELPPEDGWQERMCAELSRGRTAGRRHSIVIVAEGATDRQGRPITAHDIADVIQETLHEDTRVTILGHIQRGGTPSAYDRWASTWLGYEAAHEVLDAEPGSMGPVIGFRGNRVTRVPLMEAVTATRRVPALLADGRWDDAMDLRGPSFARDMQTFRELSEPARVEPGADARRIGIIHVGGLAPGMNAAVWAAVRLGISRGFTMVGIRDGFAGLAEGDVSDLGWSDVEGWAANGGADLGIRRNVPKIDSLYTISRQLEAHGIDGLLVIGGWNAYQSAHLLHRERERYPAFRIPIVCVPASIDNNLPGSELSIGTDTALNTIVDSIDRIKLSASATTRSFVVETMGRYCGYLALMGGLAGGSERVYLHEVPTHLSDLAADVSWLQKSFATGRKLFLAVRNERASENYTTDFLASLLTEESQGRYDVRTQVIGHIQQGGTPTPFDRLLAVRLVSYALRELEARFAENSDESSYVGLVRSAVASSPLSHMVDEIDPTYRRPRKQWWMELRPVLDAVSDSDL